MKILLIEDNPGDIGLIQSVFEASRAGNWLHVARDGDEALAFLRREAP